MGCLVYFSFPAHGHIHPTLPVVRELACRGQPVVYFGTEPYRQTIQATGASFYPYPPQLLPPEQGPGPFSQVSTTLETLLAWTGAVLDQQLDLVRSLRPTHILHDSFAPWGSLMAQLLGLPTIASVPSILINAAIDSRYGAETADPRLTPEWYAGFRSRLDTCLRRCGFREPISPPQLLQTYGDGNIVYTSRLFQPMAEDFDERRFRFVGPCFDFRPHAPPFPFERLDGRPLVLISLGTVYGNCLEFFRACAGELADAPWQIVVSTGVDFGPAPENFVVRPFVPQIEILKRCAAFVSHGGMNSVQEALYHDVPLVVVPQAADQFWIASRARELGAAAPPGGIRESIDKVLSSPGYRTAAARVGESLRAAGGHRRAADEIESFIGHPVR
jgi:MGT family glycosyltransferase